MMLHRRENIVTVLAFAFVTGHCFGLTLAPQSNLSSVAEPTSRADGLNGSVVWEDVLKNCSSFKANKEASELEGNATSSVPRECPEDQETQVPKITPSYGRLVLSVFSVLAVWLVGGNLLPIAAIIKHEKLHKPVYILVANLAASDVLAGFSFPFSSYILYTYRQDGISPSIALSRFLLTSVLLSTLSSAYSLMALTAERYWFIVHGMKYTNNVTNERCGIVIVVVWMWSGILAMLPNFGWNCADRNDVGCIWSSGVGQGTPQSYLILVLMVVFISMAAIVFFNLSIFWCLWKHVSTITAQEASVRAQPSANRKSSITIVIITTVFLIAWLPFCISTAKLVACGEDCSRTDTPMLAVAILNSAVNPLIYAFRLKEMRRGVKRVFVTNTPNAWTP